MEVPNRIWGREEKNTITDIVQGITGVMIFCGLRFFEVLMHDGLRASDGAGCMNEKRHHTFVTQQALLLKLGSRKMSLQYFKGHCLLPDQYLLLYSNAITY